MNRLRNRCDACRPHVESQGVPGEIQISPATYQLLAGNGYRFESRGSISVKGKGEMATWLLVGNSAR